MEPSPLASIYTGAQIVLWVEDVETAAYLRELWGHDPAFKFLVGAGHETITALVKDARRAGHRCVFGLRDRDFGPTNREGWGSPGREIFTLESHEFECFLLDPIALARCPLNTGRRSEAEIRERLTTTARRLAWWMACRKVISALRQAAVADFPCHPSVAQVATRDDAGRVITECAWVLATAPGLRARVERDALVAEVDAAFAEYDAAIVDGTWTGTFSGKECFRDLVGWVYAAPRAGDWQRDLVKAIAQAQRGANRIPTELQELRDQLLRRRALAPAGEAPTR